MRIVLIILFYLVSILNFAFLKHFFKLTSRTAFRDEVGDITTEVGYEEDSFGNVVTEPNNYPGQSPTDEPHVVYEPISDGPGGTF